MISAGCGSSSSARPAGWEASQANAGATNGGETTPAAPQANGPRVASGRIDRAILDAVLDAGFGHFLQGVQTEPDVREGQFVGFKLRSFFPHDERFTALDLVSGDTIVRVNGQPIERPEQALAVWNGLRVASELMVEYLRDGQRRELRFVIQD